MIDHAFLAVRDLVASSRFYESALGPLGYTRLVDTRERVAFGSKYPELWLNARPQLLQIAADTGAHLCLRAKSIEAVDAFHHIAIAAGGTDDGAPGPRQATMTTYYAAFVRDLDGNRLEVMTVPPSMVRPSIELRPPASTRAVQTFEVSLKAAIFRDGKLLLLQEADTGFWELPGGRVDVGEEWLAHADSLAREITEELGPRFLIKTRAALVTWVRQRPTDGVHQFIAARLADHTGGDAVLSAEHQALRWSIPADWNTLKFPERSDYLPGLQQVWALRASQRG